MLGKKENLPAKVQTAEIDTIDTVINQIADYPEEQLAEINPFRVKLGSGGNQVLMLDEIPLKELNCVLLNFHSENAFWVKDENDKDRLVCISYDAATPEQLEGKRADNCLRCPHNQRNTPKGERCKNNKVLHLFAPDHTPFPIVMRVPPTGIQNFKKFMTSCTMKNVHYNKLAIQISTEAAKAGTGEPYTKPVFTIVDELSDEHYEQIKLYISKILPQFKGRGPVDTSFNVEEQE